MVSALDLANVDVDGIPAIDLRHNSHADRFIPPADRFRPAVCYVTTNGRFAPEAAFENSGTVNLNTKRFVSLF